MRTDDFDFDLPEERIALHPASPRDAARMLVVDPQAKPCLSDRTVRELAQLLRAGDVLVVNDTKVIPAALHGVRTRADARTPIEVNLVRRLNAATWQAFARPGRRLALGDTIAFMRQPIEGSHAKEPAEADPSLSARVDHKAEGGLIELRFDRSGPALDAAVAALGDMPLPPYIAARRPASAADHESYQTVFATRQGAVAAPTAALHFTERLLTSLEAAGIARVTVTLHVGAGTFLPVKADDVADHKMHAEWGEITAAAADRINAARSAGGRIVAVGTTALRLLETAVDNKGTIHTFAGETDIFITPGFTFRAADVLMTNFHLPRSTLFMLVAAFSGLETTRAAYAHAIANAYRFYSYGDATLLFRAQDTPA